METVAAFAARTEQRCQRRAERATTPSIGQRFVAILEAGTRDRGPPTRSWAARRARALAGFPQP